MPPQEAPTELSLLQEIADALPIPRPWSLDEFIANLSARRDRPIHVHPMVSSTAATDLPTGLWVPSPDADWIFAEQNTSAPHREHIVCHELAHMILRHEPDPEHPGEYLGRVFDGLDPDLVAEALARTSYQLPQEQDAEVLATLIIGGPAAGPPTTPEQQPEVRQWDAVLGFDL